MPELTTEYHQRCNHDVYTEAVASSSTNAVYDVTVSRDGTIDRCDCPGFQYRGKCKHVTTLREKLCDWDDFVSEEKQTPQQEMEGICPKCGSETQVYRMGV